MTAILSTGVASSEVRVRNLSVGGAFIDGPELPASGTKVRLSRGGLSTLGAVTWQRNGQAGLKFDHHIELAAWTRAMPRSEQQGRAVGNRGPSSAGLKHVAQADSLAVISAALDQVCERMAATKALPIELTEDFAKLEALATSLRRLVRKHAF